MKNPGVCKGCKHYVTRQWSTDLKRFCNYIENTGQSRLVIERENGGYKTDSCICYEECCNRAAAGNQRKHEGGLKMQEILLSLHSEYWDLIKSGKKTYEVRTQRPQNISFPFRVIVYVTGGVGVVGKFDCDRIIHSKENMPKILANGSCMTEKELLRFSRGRGLCGWHVQEGSVCEYEMPIPLKKATGLNRPPKTLCYLRKTE